MTLKEYCKKNGISITQVARQSGIAYSTVNDILNGRIELDRVSYGKVKRIAQALCLTLPELDELGNSSLGSLPEEIRDSFSENTDKSRPWKILVRNKNYYMQTESGGKTKTERLCKVNPLNAEFVYYMAERRFQQTQRRRRLEAIWN